jgi:hypothetical protein
VEKAQSAAIVRTTELEKLAKDKVHAIQQALADSNKELKVIGKTLRSAASKITDGHLRAKLRADALSSGHDNNSVVSSKASPNFKVVQSLVNVDDLSNPKQTRLVGKLPAEHTRSQPHATAPRGTPPAIYMGGQCGSCKWRWAQMVQPHQGQLGVLGG